MSESDKLFDQLVQNAIDFLETSLEQLDKAPKYSVINFSSAVELFLKARLLAEHWSLIVSDIDKGNKNKRLTLERFKSGNFQSVNLKTAIERLRNVAGLQITKNEEESFLKVQQHRNKLVHFFHPEYKKVSKDGVINEVVPELWSAWFYLNRLLLEKWWDRFSEYSKKIRDFNYRLIYRFQDFLRAKYEAIREEIEIKKRKGINYDECIYCGFEAAEATEIDDHLVSNECEVCLRTSNILHFSCPECGPEIEIEEEEGAKCGNCGFEVDLDFLISEFGPGFDKDDPYYPGYCGECENGQASVIPYAGQYLCLHCITLHPYADNCEWCNELNAGIDLGNSYWTGCIICEGKSGWDND